MRLDATYLEAVVHGGAVLGAGGGGTIEAGLASGRAALAMGSPTLIGLDNLPDDAVLVTVSAVGTVGHGGVSQLGNQYARALELFMQASGQDIAGFMPSEVGPGAVTYGWRESAATGIPVVDAPCNGRAHPTCLMGSLSLHQVPGYETAMVAVGGDREAGTYAELTVRGNIGQAAPLIRDAAARNGGSVAVVRNPVTVAYARDNAAVGSLDRAHELGTILLQHRGGDIGALLQALSSSTGGSVLARGVVRSAAFADQGGYTVGHIIIGGESGIVEIPVCNEYMMVIQDGIPVAAFPDLITLFDTSSGLPLRSAGVEVEQSVAVFSIPRSRLTLGSTMRDRSLLHPVEKLLNITFPSEASES